MYTVNAQESRGDLFQMVPVSPPLQRKGLGHKAAKGSGLMPRGLWVMGEEVQPKSVQRRVCSLALRFSVRLLPFPSSIQVT